MSRIILYTFLVGCVWLIRRDVKRRPGVSAAVWIPTIWVGILASRPFSTWFGFSGGENALEGSPADRLFFLTTIVAAVFVLLRRRLDWVTLAANNWQILLFYGYFLVSVLWADSTVASFKRLFKDFGNVFVALVILTEANPLQAFRAAFVRCAYLLMPLSIIFIRYFPDLGRKYNPHSGEMEAIGVTFQKNSLGAMVLVCGLVLVWDWLEILRKKPAVTGRFDRWLPPAILAIGAWLLHLCDSKTSIACLLLGAGIVFADRLPLLGTRIKAFGGYTILAAIAFFALDRSIGLTQWVVGKMGRDMTFTGRTDVWQTLLSLNTDPIIGTGFCSFWSDAYYQSQLPVWVAYSAHNGYLEVYIDGGWIGIFMLAILLLVSGLKINARLADGGMYGLFCFAVLLVTLLSNFSESSYGRISPVWFLFLLTALTPLHTITFAPATQAILAPRRTAVPPRTHLPRRPSRLFFALTSHWAR